MKQKLYLLVRRMLSASKAWKLALAISSGVLVGLLPAFPFKTAVVFLISALFGLNIICLLVGELIPMFFPVISLLADRINRHFSSFTMQNLNLAFHENWLPGVRTSALTDILSGLILFAVFFCVFYLIFKLLLKRAVKYTIGHIFHDPAGTRWPVMKVALMVVACFSVVVLAMAAKSVSRSPTLPEYKFAGNITNLDSLPGAFSIKDQTLKDRDFTPHPYRAKGRHGKAVAGNKEVYAFYVSWDEASRKSLLHHLSSIDTVVTDWYTLDKTASLVKNSDAEIDADIAAAHKQEEPLVSNYIDNKWDAEVLHNLISDPKKSAAFIEAAVSDVKAHHYAGINIDFENLNNGDKKAYSAFIKKLHDAFRQENLRVSVDVPASGSAYDYITLLNSCDKMIVMAYDEHDASGAPGSIASGAWIADVLDSFNMQSDKVIVSLGSYGLDWTVGGDAADSLSFSDIMGICGENNLKVNWDQTTQNPYITYKEGNDDHVVWFLDSATFYNQARQSVESGAGGVALWRLGSEDDTVWSVLQNIDSLSSQNTLQKMSAIDIGLSVNYSGKGELLHVTGSNQPGTRSYHTDKNGAITEETYVKYPTGYTVQKFGASSNKEIALTFDDGPDAYYTPKVLEILNKFGVRATFFLIGENAQNNPDLVEREYLGGNNLGNHTFTHPNIVRVTQDQTDLELNATQRVIQEITGHSTILFRPPYNADSEPSSLEEIVPVLRAQQLGYLTVGESIDPLDWESPGKDAIVSRVMNNLQNGNIILLHDGGGTRDDTLAALPVLIQKLKDQGYTFVTVDQLMHESRDQLMPAVQSGDLYLPYNKAFFSFMYTLHQAATSIFYFTLVLGVSKLLFLGFLSALQKRKYRKKKTDSTFAPFVSVLIPCYNEETVIYKTIESVLNSNYESFEVIVVDDGSSDNSYELVRAQFGDDPRVKCFRKENGGKAFALNFGLQQAAGDIFIAIDADTLFDRDAIRLMVRYFSDPLVAAVSGNVKVGNRRKMLTQWQHSEYVTGFNLERRAYSELNCITVVPGAIGAWRKDLVLEQGGFQHDTLAEDTDMTLFLLEKGYRIEFEENAKAYTEAPETFRSLLKQRFRWTYGTLQCLWKHKSALFNRQQKTLGFIAMPFMWIFQYIFQMLCPVVDLYMLFSIFTGNFSPRIIVSYFVFLLIDLVCSLFAFRLEKENPLPILWMPIQRIVYRMMMAYIVLKSVFTAFRGKTVGWNKLKRTGNASKSTE